MKTIYILGAGASATAGLPIQNGILTKMFAPADDFMKYSKGIDFLSSSKTLLWLQESYTYFQEHRKKVADFLIKHFCERDILNQYVALGGSTQPLKLGDDIWEVFFSYLSKVNILLEDLFTLIDRSITSGDDTCSIEATAVSDFQRSLYCCIVYTMSFCMRQNMNDATSRRLVKIIIDKRMQAKLADDPVSIISLNWDILIDYNLYRCCDEINITRVRYHIYPDYGFHNYSLENLMPSTLVKNSKHYNVKLLKLHGSLNWLKCNNCGRLYTDFERDIALDILFEYKNTHQIDDHRVKCEYCSNSGYKYSMSPIIMTPTLLKDLSCLQTQNTWHNAFIDLTEANEVVFIGYSFPLADFEFRYMLKRAISPNAKIKVILINKDDPNYYMDLATPLAKKRRDPIIKTIRWNLATQRYKDFFANHIIEFYYKGLTSALDEGII